MMMYFVLYKALRELHIGLYIMHFESSDNIRFDITIAISSFTKKNILEYSGQVTLCPHASVATIYCVKQYSKYILETLT